ncbi:MAG: RNA 3'-terminal phosphate cyclase [Candidatus Nanohaloarchaea archaeon]
MKEIDGSSGGGQMLRTALTMSAVEQEPFRMRNIRGSRREPGLKPQHLEAVRSVKRLTGGEVEGAQRGSEEIVFSPEGVRPKSFTANIGTAGSTTLLLDALAPITTQFNSGCRFSVKGGTHVKFSPAFESFRSKMKLLSAFGLESSSKLERVGYYPEGGGEAVFTSENSSMEPVELIERGVLEKLNIYSRASRELEDASVADRQARELERLLKDRQPSAEVGKRVEYVDADSAGSSLVLEAVYESSRVAFDNLGEKGKRSEEVAGEVFEEFVGFGSSRAAVDKHLGDQLMIYMAIAGGEVTVPELTDHVQTNMEVLRKFGSEIVVEEGERIRLRA